MVAAPNLHARQGFRFYVHLSTFFDSMRRASGWRFGLVCGNTGIELKRHAGKETGRVYCVGDVRFAETANAGPFFTERESIVCGDCETLVAASPPRHFPGAVGYFGQRIQIF